MAYDEELAGRVRALLGREPVTEKRMFGGLAFLRGGHIVVAAGSAGLMVGVGPDGAEALLAQDGIEPVEMGARGPMSGWVRVRTEALATDEALRRWVERGLARVRDA